MRTLTRLILVLAVAWLIGACVAPASTSPVDSASGGPPATPAPSSSFTPGQPKPTLEVPPPID
jgi:hypothetical protein